MIPFIDFVWQIRDKNNHLGLVRTSLTDFRASVFAGFTCTDSILTGMSSILIDKMVMPVNMVTNTFVFRVDQILADAYYFLILAVRT